MHIVFCGDQNIVKPVVVVILSIANSCQKHEDLRISIVGMNWSQYDIDYVKNSNINIRVDYIPGDHLILPEVRKGRHVTSAAYLVLYLSDFFPNEDKILYMDHDVLVRDDRIFELWNLQLDDNPIAAVAATGVPFIGSKKGIPNWRSLGLNPRARMFNSGVMLFDLKKCREIGLKEKSLKYAFSEGRRSHLADQQALNVALDGYWKSLPLIFNAAMKVLDDEAGAYAFWETFEVDNARDNPSIVHFLGGTKPWHSDCTTKFTDEWRDYASSIKWEPWKEKSKNIKLILKHIINIVAIFRKNGA